MKEKVKKDITQKEFDLMVVAYNKLGEEVDELSKKQLEMKKQLKEYVDKHGVEDENGSKTVVSGNWTLLNQVRKSISFIQDNLEKLLKDKDLWKDCTERVINKEKVEAATKLGKISLKELNDVTMENISVAFYCKEKKGDK